MYSPRSTALGLYGNDGYVSVTLSNFRWTGYNRESFSIPYAEACDYRNFFMAVQTSLPQNVAAHVNFQRAEFYCTNYQTTLTPYNWNGVLRPGMHIVIRKIGASGRRHYPTTSMDVYAGNGIGGMGAGMGTGMVGMPGRNYYPAGGRRRSGSLTNWLLS